MDDEFGKLYNKILDGVEDWDYSDLDKITELAKKEGVTKGKMLQKQKSIEVYRNLCPSYKVQTRYECGNYSHRKEWKTKVCDMNCEYMKKFLEKI